MTHNDHNSLPLLLNYLTEGATLPYQSLVDRLGPTFDNITPRVDDGVSPHIISQLPDFVNKREDLFRAFIESYYEWLEQKTNVFGRTALLQNINDIDTTLDEYIIHFKREFLLNFPEKLAVDADGNLINEKTLLKNIKDFYRSKGSETSYEFLFRILYDSSLDLYYPKVDILKASDGNWVEESAIKVTSINGVKNFKMGTNKIEQVNSINNKITASARVYRVHQYNIGTHEVTELFLNQIVGEFTSGEKIKCTLSDGTILTETVYGLFSDVVVTNQGRGYVAGDEGTEERRQREYQVTTVDGVTADVGVGEGGRTKVTDVSLTGEIKNTEIDNGGINYVEPVRIMFEGGNGEGSGMMYPKALVKYAGYFKNNNGKLSSNKKIQDGDFYQDYSYMLKAEVSLDSYKNIVKRLIHPAGMKMFGSISLLKSLKSDLPFHSEHQAYEMPIVGHYTPYRPLSTTNLRSNGVTAAAGGPGAGWSGATGNSTGGQTYGDLYFLGYNPGATQNYHCFGNTGGKLIVRGPSLTAGSFPVGLQVSGDTSGASGEVLSFHIFSGTGDTGGNTTSNDVLGVLHLLQTRDMRPNGWCGPAGAELGELIGVTNAGHASGTAAGGWTAEICAILDGSGIVSESLLEGTTLAGLIGHDPTNIPMGTAGTEGYTAAQEYYNHTGLTAYNYWEIYHHPNTRGLSGQYIAGGWTLGIPAGMSFDRIPLKTFLKMSIGEHFHSDPETTSAYYGSPTKEYSIPYGSTSGTPNLTTT